MTRYARILHSTCAAMETRPSKSLRAFWTAWASAASILKLGDSLWPVQARSRASTSGVRSATEDGAEGHRPLWPRRLLCGGDIAPVAAGGRRHGQSTAHEGRFFLRCAAEEALEFAAEL